MADSPMLATKEQQPKSKLQVVSQLAMLKLDAQIKVF